MISTFFLAAVAAAATTRLWAAVRSGLKAPGPLVEFLIFYCGILKLKRHVSIMFERMNK